MKRPKRKRPTARQVAESRNLRLLRESEERFRSLFDRMLDGVYLSTHDGKFVDVNPAFVKMFGYSSKAEMLRIQDIKKELYFAPEERGSHVLDTGKEEVEVYRMRRKDGTEIWVEDHGRYVHDEHGNVLFHEGLLRDITERRRLEEKLQQYSLDLEKLVDERTKKLRENEDELRAARERLEYLVRSNPAAIYSGKPLPDYSDWLLTYISDSVTPILGFDPRQVADINFWKSRVHPDDVDSTHTTMGLILKEGEGSTDYRFLHRDGTYRWIREKAKVTYDSSGKPLVVNGYLTDITELKKSDEAMRESEARYRRLFESSPISLWEEDFSEVNKYFENLRRRGIEDLRSYFAEHPKDLVECARKVRIVDVNEACLRMYGAKSVDELRGELHRVFPQEFQENFVEELAALWDGKTEFSSEFDNQTLAGEIKHVRVVLNVIPGFEKSLEKVLVGVVDLTPERELERELRSTKDRLAHVLASNPAVLYLEEPLPDFSDTISTFVSESARFVLGFEPKVFLGESGLSFWRSRIHPDDLARYWAELPSLWKEGHHTFEYRFLHNDGAYRWLSEQYRVIHDAQGRITNAVAVAVDITERKQLEEKLARAERLAAIGETAAMVGHDLRNPLQGIAAAVHLLKEGPVTEGEKGKLLQVIENSLDYSDSIVRDLVDYSAEIQLKRIETTPRSIVAAAKEAVRIPGNIIVRDSSEDQPKVMVDVGRLRRVLVNLLENAFDAMPQGGELALTSSQSEGAVEISIADTGSGMPSKVMENLWRPLQTTKAKGMGLGLAICRRIVTAHGGNISVKSGAGEGTAVTIRLPVASKEVQVKKNE